MLIISYDKLRTIIHSRVNEPQLIKLFEEKIDISDFKQVDEKFLRRGSVSDRTFLPDKDTDRMVEFLKHKNAEEIAHMIARSVNHKVDISKDLITVDSGIDLYVDPHCPLF